MKRKKRRQVVVNWVRESYPRSGRHRHTYCMSEGDIFIGISLYTRWNMTAPRHIPRPFSCANPCSNEKSIPCSWYGNSFCNAARVGFAVTRRRFCAGDRRFANDRCWNYSGLRLRTRRDITYSTYSSSSSSSSSFSHPCFVPFLSCNLEYYPFWNPKEFHKVFVPYGGNLNFALRLRARKSAINQSNACEIVAQESLCFDADYLSF